MLCRDGGCVPLDACSKVACAEGLVCDPATGTCVPDSMCANFCEQGQVCRPSDGQCIPDPCVSVSCPEGTACGVVFDGTASCVPLDSPVELVTVGGSGCGCGSGTSGTGGTGSFFLVFLFVGARRLRRRLSVRERQPAR